MNCLGGAKPAAGAREQAGAGAVAPTRTIPMSTPGDVFEGAAGGRQRHAPAVLPAQQRRDHRALAAQNRIPAVVPNPKRLRDAVRSGNVALVKALLQAGAQPCMDAGDLLIQSAYRGEAAIMGLLLEAGMDPNKPDAHGESTALIWTLCGWFAPLYGRKNYTLTVKRLLDGKANPDICDDEGKAPLVWAASLRMPQAMDLLLEAGAEPNISDRSGRTPLSLAIRRRQPSSVFRLLCRGAVHQRKTRFVAHKLAAWSNEPSSTGRLRALPANAPLPCDGELAAMAQKATRAYYIDQLEKALPKTFVLDLMGSIADMLTGLPPLPLARIDPTLQALSKKGPPRQVAAVALLRWLLAMAESP